MGKKATALFMAFMMLFTMPVSLASAADFGVKEAELNGHTYVLVDESMTWDEAKAYCEEKGGYLATITTQEEQDFIIDLLAEGSKKQYWLGATDAGHEGQFRWLTGEPFTNIPGSRFDNAGKIENYLEIFAVSYYSNPAGAWNDAANNNTIEGEAFYSLGNVGLICEFGGDEPVEFNGHTYQVVNKSMTWAEAEAYCEGMGGYLATVTTAEEQAFLTNLIKDAPKNMYWLGATDEATEGVWEWVTGEKFTYKTADRLDNYQNEDYLQLLTNLKGDYSKCGAWNDANNEGIVDNIEKWFYTTENTGFICEFGNPAGVEFNGHTYILLDKSMTWTDAEAACEKMGGYLAVITSQEEQDFIIDLLAEGSKKQYWLGATDAGHEGQFRWITGEPFTNIPGSRFDNAGKIENYLEIFAVSYYSNPIGAWNDAANNNTIEGEAFFSPANVGYICEIGGGNEPAEFNGHTYQVVNKSMTWKEAKAYCEGMGGYLATVTTAEEQAFLTNLIKDAPKNFYWLGATDEETEGEWKWVTGEAFEKIGSGTFDNYNNEDYLEIYTNYLNDYSRCGEWNDANVNSAMPSTNNFFSTEFAGFICEFGEIAPAEFNGHKYELVEKSMTWKEAKAYCEAKGGYLATITTAEEQEFLLDLINRGSKYQYWLGATDEVSEGTWKWITGEKFSYREPVKFDNAHGGENYLQLLRVGLNGALPAGKWNDAKVDCSIPVEAEQWFFSLENTGFICEYGESAPVEFNGHKYELIEKSMTWAEAKAYCEEKGGYLATITSQEEQDFIVDLIRGGNKYQYWLGATDEAAEGTWKWITGEAFSYKTADKLDNYGGKEDYLQICTRWSSDPNLIGRWNDAAIDGCIDNADSWFFNTDNTGFICEFGDSVPVEFNGHQYTLIEKSMTWAEAKAYCEGLGGYLATITSEEEQEFINGLVNNGNKYQYWLGASDEAREGHWSWITGEPFLYNDPAVLDNANGGEDYLQFINKTYGFQIVNGKWNDSNNEGFVEKEQNYFATENTGFICEFGDIEPIAYNGHQYLVIDEAMTWKEAKAYCEGLGGYLATITSPEEQEFVKSLIENGPKNFYWLGATDERSEGAWEWVTGEPFAYSEPAHFDNAHGGEAYLQIYTNVKGDAGRCGEWNDANNESYVEEESNFFDTKYAGFVCEFGDSPMPVDNGNVVEFNGHKYIAINQSLSWFEAKEMCERLGGYLATITSSDEQAAVEQAITGGAKKMYWLGGTDEEDENVWKWVTGERFSYNEPTVFDNAHGGENYLQIWAVDIGASTTFGKWNDCNPTNHVENEEYIYSETNVGYVLEIGDNEMPVEQTSDTPIIYIIGRTAIYNADGKGVGAGDLGAITGVVEANAGLFAEAMVLGNWNTYANAVYNGVEPIFRDYRLNNDGEVDNGSHIAWSYSRSKLPRVQGGLYTYNFQYDGRLDPCDIADDLHQYIEDVKAVTGSDTVHVVSRCLGSNIATAYFAEYGWDDVETAVFYASAAMGYDYLSDLFSGHIAFSAESINNFVDQRVGPEDIEDDATRELVKAIVNSAQKLGLLKYGTNYAKQVFNQVAGKLVDRLVLASYGTCPGYWSMINDTRFEEAKEYVFGDEADTTYKNLVEKIDNYHYNVMNNNIDMLKEMEADGVKINVICKYGLQTPPFVSSSKELSDNTIDVYSQSFYGATCANTGHTLTKDYIKAAQKAGTDNLISGDKMIDSSTALFPDQTWYIKNYEHTPFYDCFNQMIMDMCYSEDQMTVFSDERYPQYLSLDPETETYTPIVKESADSEGGTGSGTGTGKVDPSECKHLCHQKGFLGFIWKILNVFNKLFRINKTCACGEKHW